MKFTKKSAIKLLFVVSIVILFFGGILADQDVNTSKNASNNEKLVDNTINNSGYTSDITVDCFKTESAYDLLMEDTSYEAYYANSNNRHFTYVNFTYDITSAVITIYTDDFSYDLSPLEVSTSFLVSKHENSSFELSIERNLVEDDFKISFDAKILIYSVDPVSSGGDGGGGLPVIIEEEGDEEEEPEVTPLQDLDKEFKKNPISAIIFGGVIFGFPISFGCLVLYVNNRYKEHPPTLVKHVNGEIVNLGKFIKDEPDINIGGMRLLTFKKQEEQKIGLRYVRCQDTYSRMKGTSVKRVNIFQWIFMDYHVKMFRLPKDLWFEEKIPIENRKNKYRTWMIKHFPNTNMSLRIQKKISYITDKTKTIKDVEFIQRRNATERAMPVVDVKYWQKITDEKKGEITKEIPWKRKMSYFDALVLFKDKSVCKIKMKNPRMEILHIENSEVAERYQDSVESLRATIFIQLMQLQGEWEKTVEQVTKLTKTLNYNELVQYREQAEKIRELHKARMPNLDKLMKDFAGRLKRGVPFEQAKKESMEFVDRQEWLDEKKELIKSGDYEQQIRNDEKIKVLQEYFEKQGNKEKSKIKEIMDNIEIKVEDDFKQ